MKSKSIIVNDTIRIYLRDPNIDDKGNYGTLIFSIQERGLYGDYVAEGKLTKEELKKLIKFLQKAVHVLA